jgi:hypothetical protein
LVVPSPLLFLLPLLPPLADGGPKHHAVLHPLLPVSVVRILLGLKDKTEVEITFTILK